MSVVVRAAVAVLTGAALVAALGELPRSVRTTQAKIAETAPLSPVERELYPTRLYGLPGALLLRADEVLPRDAVFHAASGPAMVGGHSVAEPFSAYWLLPRRLTTDPRQAEWILSFGADPATFEVDVEIVEDLGFEGQQLLRVRR